MPESQVLYHNAYNFIKETCNRNSKVIMSIAAKIPLLLLFGIALNLWWIFLRAKENVIDFLNISLGISLHETPH